MEHCLLLALPCGRDPLDVHSQTRALRTGFISYLQQKQAAGIINVPSTMPAQNVRTRHILCTKFNILACTDQSVQASTGTAKQQPVGTGCQPRELFDAFFFYAHSTIDRP